MIDSTDSTIPVGSHVRHRRGWRDHAIIPAGGVEPNIVDVPGDVLKSVTMPVFSHLFGIRHHAELSTAKADAVLRPRHSYRAGHEMTYEWFLSQGWADRSSHLIDSVWRATWDFDAESDVASRVAALL